MGFLDDSCRIHTVRGVYPSLREFVRRSGARLAVPSLVMIVVGSRVDAGQLRSISTLYGSDTEVIALRADLDGEARLSRIGAVTVISVTALRELAPLLDRAGR